MVFVAAARPTLLPHCFLLSSLNRCVSRPRAGEQRPDRARHPCRPNASGGPLEPFSGGKPQGRQDPSSTCPPTDAPRHDPARLILLLGLPHDRRLLQNPIAAARLEIPPATSSALVGDSAICRCAAGHAGSWLNGSPRRRARACLHCCASCRSLGLSTSPPCAHVVMGLPRVCGPLALRHDRAPASSTTACGRPARLAMSWAASARCEPVSSD